MPGWLWVVIAVALGVVIYLLLRSRGGSGRHRAPAVEYVPPPESLERVESEQVDTAPTAGRAGGASDETGAGRELRGAAHELRGAAGELRGAADTLRSPDREPDAGDRRPAEVAATDEGYNETIGDDTPSDDSQDTAAVTPESDPAPMVEERTSDDERAEEPVAEVPAAEEPVAEVPAAEEPVAELTTDDVVEGPASEEKDSEEPAAEEPEAPATGVEPSEYGAGSALPGPDGTGPRGWTVKGNADSMLFYTAEAPGFARSTADVWFESEDAASAAGFTRWDVHYR